MAYAQAVRSGKIVTGHLIRLAVDRHFRDLKHGASRGLHFSEKAATHVLEFFTYLRHSKGEWAGREFILEPWQQFLIWVLFGWLRADGTRRFRTAYIEIARKNGKSTLGAGIGAYLFFADDEPGAEVYTAATKRDQARIVHGEAIRMVKASPSLRCRIGIFKDNLHIESTNSKFEPLGADSNTLDGLNIHGAIVDELHAHRTRDVWDLLETGTAARRQPLMFAITTAGTDQESICWEQHEYGVQVVKGTIDDDTFFAFVATIDEGDDWADPSVWIKANPNLGVSVKLQGLQEQCEKAKKIPAAQNTFLRLRLNQWTQQVNRWLSLEVWDENAGEVHEQALRGASCYGGLDLSAVSDLTAWVLVFPDPEDPELLSVLCRFWCPEARLYDRQNRYQAQYQAWARNGFLRTTEGNAVDYSVVKAQVLEDAQTFQLVDCSVDRLFQGYQLTMELAEEGIKVAAMGMGFYSMAVPTRELERRLLLRKLRHGGHPVLRWMADNVSVKQDPAGNLKPDKANSQGKIDGIVALIMALDRASRHQHAERSVYEDRGILII